jgi:DNA (cytosine-5)-methyltransferase 1
MNNYLELCAGCGGLSYGLELSGLIPKALIELDNNCVNTLNRNFDNEIIIHSDIRNIDFSKYKNKIDIVVGGIPCQSFSISGKRKGLDDKNKGGLFYDFVKCLYETEPLMFMIENVEGLVNINNGDTLKDMIQKLENMEYDVSYEVLNAVNYLVPQKRKRIIIIGTSFGIKFKFPQKRNKILTIKDALKKVPNSDGVQYSDNKKNILELIPRGGCWIDLPLKLQKEYLGKSYNSGGGKRGMARRLSWNEPCLTLTTSPCQKQTERCHPDETRPLKTREYARIQTFPDDFEFLGSVNSIYRQIGNAVPPMLAYFIGNEINICLKKIKLQILINKTIFFYFEKIENSSHYNLISEKNDKYFMIEIGKLFAKYYEVNILPLYTKEPEADSIDKLKKIIDKKTFNMSENEWQKMANYCLQNSKVQQQIGKMHEYIISNLDGWTSCKGTKIPADVMKKDKSIILELKNKYNTMNSGGKKTVINNLIIIKKKFPNAIVGIGIINGRKNSKIKIKNDENIEIFQFTGTKLSEVIYGNENLFIDLENIIKQYFDKNSELINKKFLKE